MSQNLKISPVTLLTTVVWAALGASAVAWGLAMWSQDPRPLANTVAGTEPALPQVQAAGMAKMLGDTSAASLSQTTSVPAATNMNLVGVAIKQQRNAFAVISIDSQPPQPFQVGATVSPGLVLQAVTPNQARLGETMKSPTLITLELPKLP